MVLSTANVHEGVHGLMFCCSVSKVILDLKGSEFNYTYQTPPASPSSTLSRKSSISR